MLSQSAANPDLSLSDAGQATMLSTWNHGIEANAAGFLALQQAGNAMDMIEAVQGLSRQTPGLEPGHRRLPDRDGHVTRCVHGPHRQRRFCMLCARCLHPLSPAVSRRTPRT